jgi:hypothetical protein
MNQSAIWKSGPSLATPDLQHSQADFPLAFGPDRKEPSCPPPTLDHLSAKAFHPFPSGPGRFYQA